MERAKGADNHRGSHQASLREVELQEMEEWAEPQTRDSPRILETRHTSARAAGAIGQAPSSFSVASADIPCAPSTSKKLVGILG